MNSILLFAHGARDPRWAEPFAAIARRIAESGRPVELAFLDMMQPDLGEAARRLAEAGATRIDIVPLFLGSGGHLRQDLPPLVEQVRAAHPRLDVRLHPAIGESEAVIAAMAAAALALAAFGE
jgi:sirohydrochlorin cobaltochelatase